MERMVVLVALLMAAVLVLSAPMAEAKKKKKKKRHPVPALNVVQCPTDPDHDSLCFGTPGNDYLVGGPASRSEGPFDQMESREGDDVYNGGDGGDFLYDESTVSNDRYLFPSAEFGLRNGETGRAFVLDRGGGADVLDLGSYRSSDFDRYRQNEGPGLDLDGLGARDIYIAEFFTKNSIEYFRFSDRTITADEIKSEFP